MLNGFTQWGDAITLTQKGHRGVGVEGGEGGILAWTKGSRRGVGKGGRGLVWLGSASQKGSLSWRRRLGSPCHLKVGG